MGEPEKVPADEIYENLVVLQDRMKNDVNAENVRADVKTAKLVLRFITDKDERTAMELMQKTKQGSVDRRMGKTNAVALFTAAYLSTYPDSSVDIRAAGGISQTSRTDDPGKPPVFKIQSSDNIPKEGLRRWEKPPEI